MSSRAIRDSTGDVAVAGVLSLPSQQVISASEAAKGGRKLSLKAQHSTTAGATLTSSVIPRVGVLCLLLSTPYPPLRSREKTVFSGPAQGMSLAGT